MTDRRSPDRDQNPLEYELQESRAYALGRAGKRVEVAVARVEALTADAAQVQREATLDEAGQAVWSYLTTREAAGFYDHAAALAAYRVPPRVMARVGVIRRT